jgi:hypothetical protein
MRYLDLITVQVGAQLSARVSADQITKKLESTVEATLNTAVAHLSATGSVAATSPYGLGGILNAAAAKYLYQADKFDPQKLPAELAARTPVIVSCSNADVQVSCPQVSRLVRGLAQAATATTFIHLVGVDHVFNVDPSRSASNYTKPLAFSCALQKDIRVFVGRSL